MAVTRPAATVTAVAQHDAPEMLAVRGALERDRCFEVEQHDRRRARWRRSRRPLGLDPLASLAVDEGDHLPHGGGGGGGVLVQLHPLAAPHHPIHRAHLRLNLACERDGPLRVAQHAASEDGLRVEGARRAQRYLCVVARRHLVDGDAAAREGLGNDHLARRQQEQRLACAQRAGLQRPRHGECAAAATAAAAANARAEGVDDGEARADGRRRP